MGALNQESDDNFTLREFSDLILVIIVEWSEEIAEKLLDMPELAGIIVDDSDTTN